MSELELLTDCICGKHPRLYKIKQVVISNAFRECEFRSEETIYQVTCNRCGRCTKKFIGEQGQDKAIKEWNKQILNEKQEQKQNPTIMQLLALAWRQGAEYAFKQSGEGFNGEYAGGNDPDIKPIIDSFANPYEQKDTQ